MFIKKTNMILLLFCFGITLVSASEINLKVDSAGGIASDVSSVLSEPDGGSKSTKSLEKNEKEKNQKWYVRPTASIEGNGKSYETAWRGFDKIVWGGGGVNPGDTLMVCGTHTQEMSVPISGEKDNKIEINGLDPGDPGIIASSTQYGIRFDKQNYLRFVGLTFRDSDVGLASFLGCNNIDIQECKFVDLEMKGLHLHSSDSEHYVENILVKDCKFINIGEWGNSAANSLTYAGYSRNTVTQNCHFEGNGLNRGVDGILFGNSYPGNGSGHLVQKCVFEGHEENSIDLKHVIESSEKEGMTKIVDNNFSTSNQLEIVIHQGTQGVEILRNHFHNGKVAIANVYHSGHLNNMGNIIVAYNVFENFEEGLFLDPYDTGIGGNVFVNNTCKNIGYANEKNYSIQINTNNWEIKNNIFFKISQKKSPYCSIRFLSKVDMSTIDLNSNYHFLITGNKAYRLPDNAFSSATLLEKKGFQEVANGELKGRENDFVNKGTMVAGVHPTIDFDGKAVPCSGMPDIGAYENDCLE